MKKSKNGNGDDNKLQKYSNQMGQKQNLAVYVATHGPECRWMRDYCIPIDVGAAIRNNCKHFVRDDSSIDNISNKNPRYSELTGLYWIWKNDTHDYIGLYHYRRVFHLTKKNISKYLSRYDWIIPKEWIFKDLSLEKQYHYCHLAKDWKILLDVLKEKEPKYYEFAKEAFSNNNRGRFCNMFITSHENMVNYCSWLFPILFEIESRIDFNDGRSDYNKRVPAFMAERLFTLYFLYNKFKIKEVKIQGYGYITNEKCPVFLREISKKNSLINTLLSKLF